MHDLEMHPPSAEFAKCWQAAGRHIQTLGQGPLKSWLKADLNPPFLEHLSFRLGNQLFFIRIEEAGSALRVPGSRAGLMAIADGCGGIACLMPMRKQSGEWQPERSGWGLIDAKSGRVVDPPELITDEKIEMTDWELQDFAVQIVRDQLVKAGRKLMSWQGNPAVDPSIWFVGDRGPEWVVVRVVRYPGLQATPPANWASISNECARLGKEGHFASVAVASADDPGQPLWRGHALYARYVGLETGLGV